MTTLREEIINTVSAYQGIKTVTLVTLVNASSFEDYQATVEDLVKEGEIVELEYILPNMDYRVKSMYFQKGTKLIVAFPDKA